MANLKSTDQISIPKTNEDEEQRKVQDEQNQAESLELNVVSQEKAEGEMNEEILKKEANQNLDDSILLEKSDILLLEE